MSEPKKEPKQKLLTPYVPRPASQQEAKKKKNNIAYWRNTYGVIVKTHDDYLFFKTNRPLILKCKPLMEKLNSLEWVEEDFMNDNIVIGEPVADIINSLNEEVNEEKEEKDMSGN